MPHVFYFAKRQVNYNSASGNGEKTECERSPPSADEFENSLHVSNCTDKKVKHLCKKITSKSHFVMKGDLNSIFSSKTTP